MTSDARRKVIAMLRERGYAPHRQTRHGQLWRDAAGRTVLVPRPTKSGDPRAYRNAVLDIQRRGAA